MRDRLFTLACAIGALVLFVAMFVHRQKTADTRDGIPRPITTERVGNGYNAAQSWLEAEHIHGISLRERFDKLAGRKDIAPTGNLLIVTLPNVTGFRTEEFVPLDRWVRAGNTLLVLAALSDNPDWAFTSPSIAVGDLNLLTGLEFETVATRERRTRRKPPLVDEAESVSSDFSPFAQPRRATLIPNGEHAYFNGVSEAIALSDYPPHAWTVKVPYEGFVLALAPQRETGEGVLWTRPFDEGRIVVSGFGSLFTNRALGLADNGRLLANIVGANLGPRGSVLFDDVHQGLGAVYDPARFYSDRRLYITIGIVAALWFVWVLGSTRLRVPVIRTAAPREAELVRTAGGFLARVLSNSAAARRLVEQFFRRLNERTQRRVGDAPWDLLERHPRVAAADLQQLKAWYADACAARRVPLVRLYNLILTLDGQTA